MASLNKTLTNPKGVHPPAGRYSHVARVKAMEALYLAGQVAVDENGVLVGEGDAQVQTSQAYRNIGALLESEGASFDNVVQLTTYLVGRESVQPYLDGRTDVFAEIYPNGDYPPNTLLVIDGLVRPEMLVEITAVAAI